MSQLHNPFVLAYHGCEKEIGLKAINGNLDLLRSEKPFDWLGSGTYFWEGDPRRALEWAEEKKARGQIKEPFAVGAAINLGHCLDLLTREDCELVRDAADFFVAEQKATEAPMPVNRNLDKTENAEGPLRYLDCAVMNYLFKRIEGPDRIEGVKPYDTVRGYFREGEPLFTGSGFHHKNHSQIAVRNPACIKGIFIPR